MDDLIIISDVRPTRVDAVRNRDHILQIARTLFDSLGVEAVTMTTIAQEAGVGKGTLYRNFPDKLSLCQELLDHEQRDLQNRTLANLRAGVVSPLEALVWFLENALMFVWRNLDFISGGDAVIPLEHPAHYWWRQTLRGLIVQINATVDPDYLADVLYVLLDPRVIRYQRDAHHYDQAHIADQITQIARRLLTP